MNENKIRVSLDGLKSRINESMGDTITIQQENGLVSEKTFVFNPSVDRNSLNAFFSLHNWNVPGGYSEFLLIHNGAKMFDCSKYGGGMELLSIENIPNVINEYGYMFPNHCYPIGLYNSAIIYIDSNICSTSSEYLFWQSCIDSYDERINLRMDFGTWLDLFIVAQGTEFWLWPSFKPRN